MNEIAVRDLLERALGGDEPPVRPHLVGSAVRAARRTRRRQLAVGIVAVAVVVPALAFGVAAGVGALTTRANVVAPAVDTTPWEAGGAGHAQPYVRIRGGVPGFVRPVLPPSVPLTDPVPITAQAVGRLVLDDIPHGMPQGQVLASVDEPGGTERLTTAIVTVATPIGSGPVLVRLTDRKTQQQLRCEVHKGVACRDYTLSGGVLVQETAEGRALLVVSVYRPRVGEVYVRTSTTRPFRRSTGPVPSPLGFAQLLKIALDPRWGYRMSAAFVHQAASLHVRPVPGS